MRYRVYYVGAFKNNHELVAGEPGKALTYLGLACKDVTSIATEAVVKITQRAVPTT